MLNQIFAKVDHLEPLTHENAVSLLKIDNRSDDFYRLLSKANELSRKEYGDRGYVFAQIGLNSDPCTGKCKFCSLAKGSYALKSDANTNAPNLQEKSEEEILETAKNIITQNVDALFLMTTADYSQEKFLKIGAQVKPYMHPHMKLVANIGDFDLPMAKRLFEAGFQAVYHIVRLREGTDTDIPVEKRIKTLDAIRDAGLELIYCVEPIGKEHTYDEIADEMIRAREYNVDIMAAMRRVCVPGTPLFEKDEISEQELTKIVAVTRLVTRPKTSMNVHEPMKMPLLAGVNQLYAEIGSNPRDVKSDTENGRGFGILKVKQMLEEAGYFVGFKNYFYK